MPPLFARNWGCPGPTAVASLESEQKNTGKASDEGEVKCQRKPQQNGGGIKGFAAKGKFN